MDLSHPHPSSGAKVKYILGSVSLVVVLLVAWFFLGLGDLITGNTGGTVQGPQNAPFTVKYPKGWEPVAEDQLATLPGSPLAVIKNKDKKGVFIVRASAKAPAKFSELTKELSARLQKRFPDFEKTSTRTIRVGAGSAYYFAYIRKKTGTVNTIVIVPSGSKSYQINTVIASGDREAAAETAKMILSFNVSTT